MSYIQKLVDETNANWLIHWLPSGRVKSKVLSTSVYKNLNCAHRYLGTRIIKLACGHTKYQKASIPIPDWCYCWECENEQRQAHERRESNVQE